MGLAQTESDVLIVGAGVAGAVAARGLASRGISVTLVDACSVQQPVFKAEKLEPDQIELLRELDIEPARLPGLCPVEHVAVGFRGRILRIAAIPQFGFRYEDLVNGIRRALPSSIRRVEGRVVDVRASDDLQHVSLEDGSTLRARLLVLASGTTGSLLQRLGLEREFPSRRHSFCMGFDLDPSGALPAGCESLSYFGERLEHAIDYLTLFPVPGALRANLFTYWTPDDPRLRELREAPEACLSRAFPRLSRVLGNFSLLSDVEIRGIDLHRVKDPVTPGCVLLADAYQSACPATGTGLSKALVDVRTLCALVPDWLATPGMGREKLASFYSDPAKRSADEESLASARYRRRFGTDRSLAFRLHRASRLVGMWRSGLGHGAHAAVAAQLG